jgi:hypothetical protein
MSTAAALLTRPQQDALDEFLRAGTVVFVNQKRDGFENFHAKKAIALLIARVAEIEGDRLRLSPVGEMLVSERGSL